MKGVLTVVPNTDGCFAIDENFEMWRIKDAKTSKAGKKIRPALNESGYWMWGLWFNKKTKYVYKHRLLMELFKPTDGMKRLQVNHKDGNKLNNDLSNLEWVTCRQNHHHAKRNGLSVPNTASHPIETVKSIKREILNTPYYRGLYAEIGRKYGMERHAVSRIANNKTYKWLDV